MDTKMFIIDNTLQHIMWNIDALHYESNILHYCARAQLISQCVDARQLNVPT